METIPAAVERLSDARTRLLEAQRAWARANGHRADSRGYLTSVKSNLWRPLSAGALAAYNEADGNELKDCGTRPAKMKALHSSSALVVNFFDYWSERDPAPLLKALGIASAGRIHFERKYPTGLIGNAPNLDIVVDLGSSIIAIESKFCEWLSLKRPKAGAFKEKYFPAGQGLWRKRGLRACQHLAAGIFRGEVWFWHLDAPQLLKHALGLANRFGDRFALRYLYYDWPCAARDEHFEEIKRFTAYVGGEIGFSATSYQELFARVASSRPAPEPAYIEYLSTRYFPTRS